MATIQGKLVHIFGYLLAGQDDEERIRRVADLDVRADDLSRTRYPKTSLRYDPVADHRLSKVQIHKLKKAGVPKELLEPEYP